METATRDVVDGPVLIEEDEAALAVAHALSPLQFDRIAAAGPPTHRHDYVAGRIAVLMRTPNRAADSWWYASGNGVTAALEHKTGLPESAAGFIVSAASHALVLAKADRAEDYVLRLAERAACWHAGFLYALRLGH